MPIHKGRDKGGFYYRWGNRKKYYYTPGNEQEAYEKARKQAAAIYASGWKH